MARPCGGCGDMVESDERGFVYDFGIGGRRFTLMHSCRPESPCCGMTLYPENDLTDHASCNQCGQVYSVSVVKREQRSASVVKETHAESVGAGTGEGVRDDDPSRKGVQAPSSCSDQPACGTQGDEA